MLKPTKVAAGVLVACGGVLLSAGVLAQDQGQQLERVTITGSNIKRTDAETASPVQVLTRDEIERTGKQTIQEVLRSLSIDGQGSIPSSFSAGFAGGASAVSLRGLGVNSTLVLINGHRMTTYGLADDGQRTFVDLNSIPLEVVERVEVLKDGASAIYGADAVGGVINVILRKSYTGGSIGGSYGQTGHSDGRTSRAFGTYGFGDLDADGYNVFFSLEGSTQQSIKSTDRGFLGKSDLRSRGFFDTTIGAARPWLGVGVGPTRNNPWGAVLNPATGAYTNLTTCPSVDATTGACRYNALIDQEIQPKQDRINFFGRGTLQINSNLQGYAELGVFNSVQKASGTLGAVTDGGVYNPSNPTEPVFTHGFLTLPAAHPQNPFGTDVAMGLRPFLGGRDHESNTTVTRLFAGVQGSAFDWDYDVSVGWIKSRLKDVNTGYVRYDVLQDALNNGTYRINDPTVSSDVIREISPRLERRPESSVKLIDTKASRELFELPGGKLGLALGAELRQEKTTTPPVPYTDTAEISGLGYSAFNASREVWAIYGEATAPVTKWLELSGALRADHYSDFGYATTPKFGFKLKPMEQVALRGTYAKAFRAPGPAETGGSTLGFTSVGILSLGNPDLKPEKAETYTLGVVVDPLPGLSATIDYYKVNRRNEIVQADPTPILDGIPTNGTPLSRVPGALPGSFVYYDAEGLLGSVSGTYRNAAATRTDGVDMELRQRLSFEGVGRFTAQLNWTHVNSFKRTDANGEFLEYAGTQGPIVLSSGSGTPKDRASFALTWERGPVAVSGVMNYVGPLKLIDHEGQVLADNGDGTVTDEVNGLTYTRGDSLRCGVLNPDGSVPNGCRLPSFTTFDVFAKWTPAKNLDLNFSIQNLFDRKAPFDQYTVLTYGINYNQAWHQAGAVGRFFTVGAKYTF